MRIDLKPIKRLAIPTTKETKGSNHQSLGMLSIIIVFKNKEHAKIVPNNEQYPSFKSARESSKTDIWSFTTVIKKKTMVNRRDMVISRPALRLWTSSAPTLKSNMAENTIPVPSKSRMNEIATLTMKMKMKMKMRGKRSV